MEVYMEYKVSKCESLYDGFFKLNKYHLSNELFNGGWSNIYTREIFERGYASAVMLFDQKQDKLIFVEQFRPGAMETGTSPWLMELVAGMIEPGELPEEVVCRESVEEAGLEVIRLKKICDYMVSPGGTTERIWLFLGEVDSDNAPEYAGLDCENEDIKVHCVSTEQAFNWLETGYINNAMTIIALQWLKLKLLNKQVIWD
jgi:ADP-ribose pyrophosphatase